MLFVIGKIQSENIFSPEITDQLWDFFQTADRNLIYVNNILFFLFVIYTLFTCQPPWWLLGYAVGDK